MSTPIHSPAPWYHEFSPYRVRISGAHGSKKPGDLIPTYGVYDVYGDKVFDTNEDTADALQEANARLGSAAPRLLAALIDCASLLTDCEGSDGEEYEAWREAIAAIAEATGGQHE
jgi:hypothetical protein